MIKRQASKPAVVVLSFQMTSTTNEYSSCHLGAVPHILYLLHEQKTLGWFNGEVSLCKGVEDLTKTQVVKVQAITLGRTLRKTIKVGGGHIRISRAIRQHTGRGKTRLQKLRSMFVRICLVVQQPANTTKTGAGPLWISCASQHVINVWSTVWTCTQHPLHQALEHLWPNLNSHGQH